MTNAPLPPKLDDVLTTLTRLKPYLEATWGVTILAVFGSVARGEATINSDVDLLFDYEKPLGWHLADVGDYLETSLGRKVDLLSKKAVRPVVWQTIQDDMRYV
jgi:uncharacterized protein